VEGSAEWRARVVYGDTDSLFVLLECVFVWYMSLTGREIAAAVSAANPPAVVLKLEKVRAASISRHSSLASL
jgi:DNA polymerase zeta